MQHYRPAIAVLFPQHLYIDVSTVQYMHELAKSHQSYAYKNLVIPILQILFFFPPDAEYVCLAQMIQMSRIWLAKLIFTV